jgi:hypothetical protein
MTRKVGHLPPVFPRGLVQGKREILYTLAPRIYTNGAQQTASGAVSQLTNGWAAHHSGQLLMFEGKTCSTFRVIYQ